MTINRRHRRAPRQCPVCDQHLRVTQLGCDACGTGISGDFEPCEFCALDAADLDVLRVFLSSRGNVKELGRHLGVSYPTARQRLDEMVRKLGLSIDAGADADGRSSTSPNGAADGEPVGQPDDARLTTLRALAKGTLDVSQARRLIQNG